jgi:hypothetical protein
VPDKAGMPALCGPQFALLNCDEQGAAQLIASIHSLATDLGGTIRNEAIDSHSTMLTITVPQRHLDKLTGALLLGGATFLPHQTVGQNSLTVILRATLPGKQPSDPDDPAQYLATGRGGETR